MTLTIGIDGKPRPPRYFRDRVYIGVRETHKDCTGGWVRERTVTTFRGKPYNPYEFDAIYDFNMELLKSLHCGEWRSDRHMVKEPVEAIIARGEMAVSVDKIGICNW